MASDELMELMQHTTDLYAGRIECIRSACEASIKLDRTHETGSSDWTDRHWLAQLVLDVLDGKIDDQIKAGGLLDDDPLLPMSDEHQQMIFGAMDKSDLAQTQVMRDYYQTQRDRKST